MESKKLILTSARIHGLEKEPYYFNCFGAYGSNLTFSDHPNADSLALNGFKTGNTENESKTFMEKLRNTFKIAGIHSNSEVFLLTDSTNTVLAIASTETPYYWIDVRDLFKLKDFHSLNIVSKL